MTTNSWIVATGLLFPGQWTTAGDWSLNHVPMSTENAYVGNNGGTATVISSANEAVNSVATNVSDILDINGGVFIATQGTGPDTNTGTINISNSATLEFGADNTSSTVNNNGLIALFLTTSGFLHFGSTVEIAGTVAIDSSSSGHIQLNGSQDQIVSDGHAATLSLTGGLLDGSGQIGDGNLQLNVEPGAIVDADVSSGALDLETGSNTIDNDGTLEVTGGSEMELFSPVANIGTIAVVDGQIIASGNVSGNGTIDIGLDSQFYAEGSIDAVVHFTGAGATLGLSGGFNMEGEIEGAVATDTFALEVPFAVGEQVVWEENSGSAGGNLVLFSGNTVLAELTLVGQYNGLDFVAFSDFDGTYITVRNAPTPNDFNGNGISDMLWRNSNGTLAMWLMNGSAISSSAAPMSGGSAVSPDSSWSVAGIGDFTGIANSDIDADILWRQSSTGSLAVWFMSGSTIASSAAPTYQGNVISPDSSWSVAGIGDFSGDGADDILWRQSSTGSLIDWSMNGSTIESGLTVTSQGAAVTPDSSWSVAAIGDFNSDFSGEADILWRQSSTGSLALWQMDGSTVTSSASLTTFSSANVASGNAVTPDSTWSIAGVGDFTGSGISDLLWRQSSTGSLAMWLMNGSTITSSAAPTSQGNVVTPNSTWNIVEVGDFNGPGNADILWQQSTTGALVEWQMSGSTIVASQAVTSQGTPIAPPNTWQSQANPTDSA